MTVVEILSQSMREYQLPIRPAIKGRIKTSALYVLALENGEIAYVGTTIDLDNRLCEHRPFYACRSGTRLAYVFWIPLPAKVFPFYEGALIRALRPTNNRMAPKYFGYDNEILDGLGLPVHPNESTIESDWQIYLWESKEMRIRQDSNDEHDPDSIQ